MLRPWSKPASSPPSLPPRVFCLLYTCFYPTDLLEKQPYNRAQCTHIYIPIHTASLYFSRLFAFFPSPIFLPHSLLLLPFAPLPPLLLIFSLSFFRALARLSWSRNLPREREPSRLWLPSTLLLLLLLLREVLEVGRGPRYRFVENLLRHLLRQPPSFSSYVSLLCNEPAKICLEKFLILGGDPSLREISDGESFALPFFRSVAGMLIWGLYSISNEFQFISSKMFRISSTVHDDEFWLLK